METQTKKPGCPGFSSLNVYHWKGFYVFDPGQETPEFNFTGKSEFQRFIVQYIVKVHGNEVRVS